MSQSTFPFSHGHSRLKQPDIMVEVGSQPLPPRMRLSGLRRSVGMPTPVAQAMRRLLMAPVAMTLRMLSR